MSHDVFLAIHSRENHPPNHASHFFTPITVRQGSQDLFSKERKSYDSSYADTACPSTVSGNDAHGTQSTKYVMRYLGARILAFVSCL